MSADTGLLCQQIQGHRVRRYKATVSADTGLLCQQLQGYCQQILGYHVSRYKTTVSADTRLLCQQTQGYCVSKYKATMSADVLTTLVHTQSPSGSDLPLSWQTVRCGESMVGWGRSKKIRDCSEHSGQLASMHTKLEDRQTRQTYNKSKSLMLITL